MKARPRLLAFAFLALQLLPPLSAGGEIANCPIFPADNFWNVPVDELPVAPQSDDYVAAIGADAPVHPDFGSGTWPPDTGGPIGIPFVAVPQGTRRVPVSFQFAQESDPGPYPIPADAPIEGGANSDGDRHVLIVEQVECVLYELFNAFPEDGGSRWRAGSGAVFDLRSNELRPEGWTSADAAGLPILPGLVRFDEVASGEISHALRFTAPRTRKDHVWPARHHASDLTAEQFPPMGQRFRLRSDFDISGFRPEVRVILKALQKYGMILADNGSPWFLSGAPDERWDNEALRQLRTVRGRDFEAVDSSPLMVDPDSARTFSGERTSVFPQVAHGSSAAIRFKTALTWVNLGDGASVKVAFFDPRGRPWDVTLSPLGSGSEFVFNLDRGESFTAATTGQGALEVGYALMAAPPQVRGMAVFSGTEVPQQTTLYEAGARATELQADFSVAVDTLGHRDTGLVLVNPKGDGAASAQVTLRLYTQASQPIAARMLELQPGRHLARFAYEFFSDPDASAQAREMRGTLTVHSDRPLAALALRQNDDPARDFPDDVPTLTTIPILPGRPE